MVTIAPGSPCEARVLPGTDGGLAVELFVPTCEGGATLTLVAERDPVGDWRVFIPWPDSVTDDDACSVSGGLGDAANGILYLAAPDRPVDRDDTGGAGNAPTYSLAEIRDGTGWPAGVRFLPMLGVPS